MDDVYAASCRVSVANARGSGLFVHYEGGYCYVLTNQHVVDNNATATLQFWKNHRMESVSGRVVERYRAENPPLDFALIAVDAAALKRIDPPFVPLAPVEIPDLTRAEFVSAGAPKGWNVTAWLGEFNDANEGVLYFQPHPVPGQSGSGVCAIIDGEVFAVATVTYLIGDQNSDASKGGALSAANFIKTFTQRHGVKFGAKRVGRRLIADKDGDEDGEHAEISRDGGVIIEGTSDNPILTLPVFVTDPKTYDAPDLVQSVNESYSPTVDLLKGWRERKGSSDGG